MEIIFKDVRSPIRLTVTLSRVTLKLSNGMSEAEQKRYINFANTVVARLGKIDKTWRGVITLDEKLYAIMQNDSKSYNKAFVEL